MTGSTPYSNQDNTLITPRENQDLYSRLYLSSQELARASGIEDIRDAVSRALNMAHFPSLLLTVQQNLESDEEVLVPYLPKDAGAVHAYFAHGLPVDLPRLPLLKIETSLFVQGEQAASGDFGHSFVDFLVMDLNNPEQNPGPLGDFARRLGFATVAFIPVSHTKHLDLLFLIGSRQGLLTRDQLQPYVGLADLTRSAFERVYTQQVLEKRLTMLQSLNVISQAVAFQADLNELYRTIHHEIRQLLGEVTFYIALYDAVSNMVEIPYLFEMGSDQVIQPPPFPLGMGLTSLVIQNRQPILLVEDTLRRLQELGAQQAGLPAKSWMGVPMLVAGEVTGAIVVQDLYLEHRFDEGDLQLMVTLASQVAVTVRYVSLLTNAHRQAERERTLNEITAQIRASSDAQKILQTAAREVARVVGARRTRLVILPADEKRIEEQL